jgi:Flp pilus assembly protein TadD
MMVGAISDLGLCLRAQGRKDDAEAAWRRALEINPRFASARQNLEAATAPVGTKP